MTEGLRLVHNALESQGPIPKDMTPRGSLDTVPDFSQYDAIEPYILSQVHQWFYEGPLFRKLRRGALSTPELRYFTVQYGHYSSHFPRVLGAAIAAMAPQDAWWIPLADNLWDEAGRGIPGGSHQQLYATFMHSVDPNLNLKCFAIGPAVQQAIHSFLGFFHQAAPLEAMAAVGLGSELFAGTVMGWLLEGLSHPHYQIHHPLNLEFWRVHVTQDEPRHYALCKAVLESAPATALPHLVDIGLDIARSEAKMYTGILLEMKQFTAS